MIEQKWKNSFTVKDASFESFDILRSVFLEVGCDVPSGGGGPHSRCRGESTSPFPSGHLYRICFVAFLPQRQPQTNRPFNMISSASTSTTPTVSTASIRTARLRVRGYPADYDVYESKVADSNSPSQQVGTRVTAGETRAHNPAGWPDDYRRIPPHRPINRHLDQSQRRVYTSLGERAFLTIMFTGLEMNVVSGACLCPHAGDLCANGDRLQTVCGRSPGSDCLKICLHTSWVASFECIAHSRKYITTYNSFSVWNTLSNMLNIEEGNARSSLLSSIRVNSAAAIQFHTFHSIQRKPRQ